MTTFPLTSPLPFHPEVKMLVVCATQKKASGNGHDIIPIRCLSDYIRIPAEFEVFASIAYDNHDGLSKVYNTALNNMSEKYDIVLLVHDDIVVNDCLIYEKLKSAMDKGLDVVGVAGGKGWQIPIGADPNKVPIGWTTATRNAGACGQMMHVVTNSATKKDYYVSTTYGQSPAAALTVDGSFMCLMNRGLELRFDEQFDFDFYDMDLCFEAFKRKMRVGVEPILCTHASIGMGVMKKEFLDSQMKFMKKHFVAKM